MSGKGASPGQFTGAIRGIAVAGTGLVYAVGDVAVKVFHPEGDLEREWPTAGPGYSVGLTPSPAGSVLIGEEGRVEQFSPDGRLLSTLQDGDRLGRATSVGVFGDFILVGDATHRRIRRYDKAGAFINDIGADNKTKGFVIPNGHIDFAVDSDGVIHATNPGKHRVERYSLEGKLLDYFGRFGGTDPTGFCGCCNPTNLALTAGGHVIVTVKAPPLAKVYDKSGGLLAVFATDVLDPHCKNMDVATDSKGCVCIVDTVRLQIQVFEPFDITSEDKRAAEGKQTP